MYQARGQFWKPVKATLIVAALVSFLASCDDAEERAERHFETAMELLENGDFDRATVEFRNVFKLNLTHRDARAAYAGMRRQMEDYPEALGQYQRLVEQFPGDVEALTALVEMYAELGVWDQLSRFLDAGMDAAPENETFKAYNVVRNYRLAVEARDPDAAMAAAEAAIPYLEERPDNLALRRILIDDSMRRGQMEDALVQLDLALQMAPNEESLFPVRLSVLAALGDTFAMEEQLRANIADFPENQNYRLTLVRLFVAEDRLDAAEAVLRDAVQESLQDLPRRMTLVQFLNDLRSPDAAIAELDQMIVQGFDTPEVLARRATIVYGTGQTQRAIEQLESLIAQLGDDQDATREIRVDLALMYKLEGETEKGLSLVEGVIAEDNAHVAARKMQANWLIDADATGDAIAALRIALEQDPLDSQIYTLLARAHNRDGNDELVGDMLALAVETSDRAARESIQYAQYLLTRGKIGPAETVIIDALRIEPTNEELLKLLGLAYVNLREWGRLEQVIQTLANLETETSQSLANDLMTRMLQIQERADETVSFLERLVADGGPTGLDADAIIVRTHLGRSQPERAFDYLNEQKTLRPEESTLDYLLAAVYAANGDVPAAVSTFDALVEAHPSDGRYWQGYFNLLFSQGRESEALDIVERGINLAENPATLLWIRASFHERAGETEQAIAIYEGMYQANNDNLIVANNLANLLVQGEPDEDTIVRAYRIARRLGSSDLPPYLDTYGWISVLRGDFSEAVRTLEPAAAAMVNDPSVQYHLARAYQGANRLQAALTQYRKVLALVSEDTNEAFVLDARERAALLEQDPAAANSN
jgi:tetratricopeptide (TPR) repeat protein